MSGIVAAAWLVVSIIGAMVNPGRADFWSTSVVASLVVSTVLIPLSVFNARPLPPRSTQTVRWSRGRAVLYVVGALLTGWYLTSLVGLGFAVMDGSDPRIAYWSTHMFWALGVLLSWLGLALTVALIRRSTTDVEVAEPFVPEQAQRLSLETFEDTTPDEPWTAADEAVPAGHDVNHGRTSNNG